MGIDVRCTDDAASALDEGWDFLVARPAHHNLILTLLTARAGHPQPGRYWLVRVDGEVAGVAFLSPLEFYVTVTPMADEALDALVANMVADGAAPAGVNGEAATSARVAGQWTERTGSAAVPDMGMRIYRLGDLVPPDDVPGALRPASVGDADVVQEMLRGFHRDTGDPSVVSDAETQDRIAAGSYFLWEDGEPRAIVGRSQPIAAMSRIYAVYTPSGWRRRGYAAAAVAELSRRIRGEGHDAMLFTDLGNPTSNSVYRRIGYRAVAENVRYRFLP